MIFVETRGRWCTAVLMLHAYVYHVIEMFILLMPFQSVTQEPFCVRGAIHNQLSSGVLKRELHYARTVIGWAMVPQHLLQHIRGKQSIAIPAALQQKNFLQYGHLS